MLPIIIDNGNIQKSIIWGAYLCLEVSEANHETISLFHRVNDIHLFPNIEHNITIL